MKQHRCTLIWFAILAFSTMPLALGQSTGEHINIASPKGWLSLSPDQLTWTKLSDGTGREIAYAVGGRDQPGLYIQFVKWPPHGTSKAHSHPDERYCVVLSGTFYIGHGEKFDAGKLEKRSSGTFFTEPASVAHFGAAGDEGAILYFVGTGPSRTDVIEK